MKKIKEVLPKMNKEFFDQFVTYDYNRPVDESHINEFIESINIRGFAKELSILVSPKDNEVCPGFHVILDGQHRNAACEYLDKLFTFVIVEDAVTKEQILDKIKLYNVERKNLIPDDYLNINKDISDYKKLSILRTATGFRTYSLLRITNSDSKLFKKGLFTITDENVDKIATISELHDIIKNNVRFTPSVYIQPLSIILSDPNINVDTLRSQLEKHSGSVLTKTTLHRHVKNLYECYNKNLRVGRVNIPESITIKIK